MNELNGKQNKLLKSLAHHLKPVIQIGQKGVTDSIYQAINSVLDDHELIKVKFLEFKKEKKEISELISKETSSSLVSIVGNMAIFFRKSNDEKKRKIIL